MTFGDVPLPDMPTLPPVPEPDAPVTVWIHFDGFVELTPEEVFPDGVPEDWSAESVRDIMSSEGYGTLLSDWGLWSSLEIYVTDSRSTKSPLLVSP